MKIYDYEIKKNLINPKNETFAGPSFGTEAWYDNRTRTIHIVAESQISWHNQNAKKSLRGPESSRFTLGLEKEAKTTTVSSFITDPKVIEEYIKSNYKEYRLVAKQEILVNEKGEIIKHLYSQTCSSRHKKDKKDFKYIQPRNLLLKEEIDTIAKKFI